MDYQNTKIYKIWSPIGNKIYIGSTTKQYLSQRMTAHKNGYNRWKAKNGGKITSYELFEEYGFENCNIELIESHPCNSKDEKNKREGHYIRTLDCVNKIILGKTRKEYGIEYRLEHKTELNEKSKIYHEKNKTKILERKKIYREKEAISEKNKMKFECSCGSSCRIAEKSKHNKSKKHLKYINENPDVIAS